MNRDNSTIKSLPSHIVSISIACPNAAIRSISAAQRLMISRQGNLTMKKKLAKDIAKISKCSFKQGKFPPA